MKDTVAPILIATRTAQIDKDTKKLMTQTQIEAHYDQTYFNWQQDIGAFGGEASAPKFQKYIHDDDVVADFGCGGGYLLANIRCKKRIGIEVNEAAHPQIEKNGCLAFSSAREVSSKFGAEAIDVIISNNALEHVKNPYAELLSLYPLLRKGGKIIFIVPCDKVAFKYKPNDINFHLYSWSPMNLGNLFSAAGFKVLQSQPYFHKWPPFYRKVRAFWD